MFRKFLLRKSMLVWLALTSFAVSMLLAGGGSQARADTQHELYLAHATGWCATYNPVEYGAVVLGQCADAATQQWYLQTVSGNIFQIRIDAIPADGSPSLCMTWNYPNGSPDGGAMILGVCRGAQTQQFQFTQLNGGWQYIMPWRSDNHGNQIALDDANYQLAVYNKIDGSFRGGAIYGQQQWSELFTTP